MSKIDYNELVKFVRTHDEYYVAEFMFADNKRIAELEQELAELKEKDNYHLLYELAGADETIANLKKQLEEKDKDQTQLAMQELEKVKAWLEPKYFDYEQINYLTRIIDNQIKELKGE